MKTSLFDFHLPDSLIAARPASPRDAARMLVIGSALKDSAVRNLPQCLEPGDVMVFNDTRVIPARLWGKKGEGKIEVLLHRKFPSPERGEGGERQRAGGGKSSDQQDPLPNPPPKGGREYWFCFAKPARKLKPGDRIEFAADFSATVQEKLPDGQIVLAFQSENLRENLERHGHMPLPPYIEKQRRADDSDKSHYQTVYAKREGSVAAPTAGLHFTEDLLRAIDAAGVRRVHITLHVGGGTFLPVKAEDTKDHVMHGEWAEITPEAARAINAAKRVIAVGTTSLRTLESATDDKGRVQPFSGETDIFITPGYEFTAADMLLTNFHLPRSTLFMLVCAFAGTERMKTAYAHAIARKYRFYSYGDCCLLYKNVIPAKAGISGAT